MQKYAIIAAITLAATACSGEKSASSGPAAEFKTEKVGLPGEGRGDYLLVDDASNRLFVTHAAVVHILALDTLKPVATVTGLTKAGGVTLAGGKGFASDGEGNQVVVFNPETGKTIKSLKTGTKPDSILTDAATGNVFVFNGKSNNFSVIDPKTLTVTKTIALPDAPESARSDGKGKIYVNLGDTHAIGVIDAAKAALTTSYVMDDCEGPAALAIDTEHNRLFSSCENKSLKVVDATNGKTIAALPVGEDPDGILYDAANKRVIAGGRDGNWTIIDQTDADHYAVNSTYKIDPYAKTLALDSKTGRIFSSTADLVWPEKVPGKKWLPNAKSGTFRLMVVSPK